MIERLDRKGIVELARRTDELGVLSIYMNVNPRQDPHSQGAAIDLRNRFRELQRRLAEEGEDGSRELASALERVWPQVEGLLSPGASGRGRLAFLGLGSDWVAQLDSQLPGEQSRGG